jgi:NADH-ubiquinone oxidoreductase chain 4
MKSLNYYIILIVVFFAYQYTLGKVSYTKLFGLYLSLSIIIIPIYLIIIIDNSLYNFLYQSDIPIIGFDGVSLVFISLTVILTPLSIIANWNNIKNSNFYILILLILEILLIILFSVLDIFYFYIIFELTLPCLFILIGLAGNRYKIKASLYIFIYTMLGSLFLLISILFIIKIFGSTDFFSLFNNNINNLHQSYIFIGLFIAFAVKTPLLPLHIWLLKAHVESPLSGSMILAGIILKLSAFGIIRLIIPITPKSLWDYSIYLGILGIITIIIISISTIRASDIKELIAYSSISHAAVYILGIISNNMQGIEGGILLGLGHGFVSPALFIITGGILYDRYHSRDINSIRGVIQIMPLFSIFFFLFTLSNCGVPLSLNFIGEFLSLYGFFEKLPILGIFASLSIILSAGYSIFLFNRITFGNYLSINYLLSSIPDISKQENYLLIYLAVLTIVLGIFPNFCLNIISMNLSNLIWKPII